MSYATHEIKAGLLRQQILRAGLMQRYMADGNRRQAGVSSQLPDPAHFSNGVATVPFRFDEHGRFDPKLTRVAQIISREVIPLDRAVIAVAKRNLRLIAQPRQIVGIQIPEMLMGIDDGNLEQSVLLYMSSDVEYAARKPRPIGASASIAL